MRFILMLAFEFLAAYSPPFKSRHVPTPAQLRLETGTDG